MKISPLNRQLFLIKSLTHWLCFIVITINCPLSLSWKNWDHIASSTSIFEWFFDLNDKPFWLCIWNVFLQSETVRKEAINTLLPAPSVYKDVYPHMWFSWSSILLHEGDHGISNTFGPRIKLVPYERKQHQSPLPIHLQTLTRPIINLSVGSFTVME